MGMRLLLLAPGTCRVEAPVVLEDGLVLPTACVYEGGAPAGGASPLMMPGVEVGLGLQIGCTGCKSYVRSCATVELSMFACRKLRIRRENCECGSDNSQLTMAKVEVIVVTSRRSTSRAKNKDCGNVIPRFLFASCT